MARRSRPRTEPVTVTDSPASPGVEQEIAFDVEQEIAFDMVRRGLPVAPLMIGAAALVWGWGGALSTTFGIVLVLANFAFSAVMLTRAARVSPVVLGAAALFGYLLRLAFVAGAVLAVKDASWVRLVPLCFAIVVTHLGLLVWELPHVSASLAYPGLKPALRQPGLGSPAWRGGRGWGPGRAYKQRKG